jgi:hypothetical protein
MDKHAVTSDPRDDENDIDGCEVFIENPTSDEELPITEGGVG